MKVHLYDCDEPAKVGGTLVAACQTEVANAQFVFMWDTEVLDVNDIIHAAIGMCRKCLFVELEKRYVYGISSGDGRNFQEIP